MDLEDLKKLKFPKKKKPSRPKMPEKPKPEHIPEQTDEENVFARAMLGVEPLDGEGGRQIPPASEPPPVEVPDREEEGRETMQAFMRGEIEFELEYTEEYMHGHVRGLDQRDLFKLKQGQLSIEGHLDLHGMNSDQAYDALLFFLRESFLQGRRCVLLIPGRGLGSPGGVGLIRQELQRWLTRDPLKRIVLAFATAQPKHGGAGALYVLLRKRKKTEGKVQWERLPGWTP